ncbi:hypothetical protein KI387_004740, partial [Taxus chinensis]
VAGIDGLLDVGETSVSIVEATVAVWIGRLDATKVVVVLVDGLMGEGEVVIVGDSLTGTSTSLGRYSMLYVLK